MSNTDGGARPSQPAPFVFDFGAASTATTQPQKPAQLLFSASPPPPPAFVFDLGTNTSPTTTAPLNFEFNAPAFTSSTSGSGSGNPFQQPAFNPIFDVKSSVTAPAPVPVPASAVKSSASKKKQTQMIKLDRLKIAPAAPGTDPFLTNMIWTALTANGGSGGGTGSSGGGSGGGLPVLELVSLIASFLKDWTFSVRKQAVSGDGGGGGGAIEGVLYYQCVPALDGKEKGGIRESILICRTAYQTRFRMSLPDGALSTLTVPEQPFDFTECGLCADPVRPTCYYISTVTTFSLSFSLSLRYQYQYRYPSYWLGWLIVTFDVEL